ncbi:MAG: M13 family metallopeptidase, partial [Pseudomonadota bacterium]|nr:M13 family metallopeptidase [Pseudomonadota bacterium]
MSHAIFHFRRALACAALSVALPGLAADLVQGASPAVRDRRDASACTDFYGYVNRQWLETTEIPLDRSSWGAFSEVDKRTRADLRNILEEPARVGSGLANGPRKVLQFYRSGMDTAAIERAGIEPLKPEIARIRAIDSTDALIDTLAHLHRSGVPAGFQFTLTTDPLDSNRYLPELYQSGLGLPDREYYFRSDAKAVSQRDAYVTHVARMFELLGDSADLASTEAATVMRLETLLAKASMTQEQRRDPVAVSHKLAVSDLSLIAPGVNWTRYLRALGAGEFTHVNVAQPEFLKAFAEAAGAEPPADWRTYLRWHLIHAAAGKLPAPFVDEDFRFYGNVLTGRKELAPRNEQVIETITGRYGNAPMAMALGEMYVDRRFTPEAKARALILVENLRAVLRERLSELDWMSEPTRRAAMRKLETMHAKIAYPDRWRDYSALAIEGKPYVTQWLTANAFDTDRAIALIRKPVDRNEWFTSPHLTNAFYQSHTNSIVFPAAILQPPFFDPARDDAMNYGGIGMVIGHEITH